MIGGLKVIFSVTLKIVYCLLEPLVLIFGNIVFYVKGSVVHHVTKYFKVCPNINLDIARIFKISSDLNTTSAIEFCGRTHCIIYAL